MSRITFANSPWEQQPSESLDAFEKFNIYRDLLASERSYTIVARQVGMTPNSVRTLGIANRWTERACAWDIHINRARQSATEVYQVEMAARHAQIASNMLVKVAERLEKVNILQLAPKDIAAWLEVGVKVERLSRGLHTSDPEGSPGTVNNNITNNILTLSDQDLIQALAREGVRRGNEIKKLDAITVPATGGTGKSSSST
jgi:hypothetical protein